MFGEAALDLGGISSIFLTGGGDEDERFSGTEEDGDE